jgi:hypothetical protein
MEVSGSAPERLSAFVDLAPVWLTRRRRRGDKEWQVEINLRIK